MQTLAVSALHRIPSSVPQVCPCLTSQLGKSLAVLSQSKARPFLHCVPMECTLCLSRPSCLAEKDVIGSDTVVSTWTAAGCMAMLASQVHATEGVENCCRAEERLRLEALRDGQAAAAGAAQPVVAKGKPAKPDHKVTLHKPMPPHQIR